jgi:hypothetical protein
MKRIFSSVEGWDKGKQNSALILQMAILHKQCGQKAKKG